MKTMFADWNFYKDTYKGFLISETEFGYFGERASDVLASYAAAIGTDTDEKLTAFKKTECRIADILFGDFKTSKFGAAKINSESVNGYYTVAYGASTQSDVTAKVDDAIRVYLGRWLVRRARVIL